MSERKVLNKYFPPDFDPSKIKRRRTGVKNPQITVTLMAPFSMRCMKCGDYTYKGKKFNARKETAVGEDYMGVKVFRFYIKCPTCSSEFTFKTDPKNADFTMEHGATRNFDNWKENDPNGTAGLLPGADADEEYDDEGNDREARDAMADLERSQEQSRREMEDMDELADLRALNARHETSRAADDPEALLAKLHAKRISAAEEARRKAEDAEDDALVAQYFSKVAAPVAGAGPSKKPASADSGSSDEDAKAQAADGDASPDANAETSAPATITLKRRPPPGEGEPTVATLLAAKGKALDKPPPPSSNTAQVKRKREGMQKLLGIKKVNKKVKT